MENLLKILSQPDNIPIVGMLVFVFYFVWLGLKEARKNDRLITAGEYDKLKAESDGKIHVWPYLARKEFIAAIIVIVVLIVWSLVLDAPLEEPPNPGNPPNPAKAPWYFLGLQEMLVYFDPWIAGVLLPVLIIIGLMLIPYLDINPKGNGYYTFKERKFVYLIYCFGFIGLWVFLIIIGTFFRGPGWNFFVPWEYWDHHKVVAITNINLSELFGIYSYFWASVFGGLVVIGYYAVGVIYYLRRKAKSRFIQKLGLLRYSIIAYLLLTMLSLPIKIFLRLAFNIKYVWATPWFNI